MKSWNFNNIPSQQGRLALVTGANSGLGLETARMLALKGAYVVIGCRDRKKGELARSRILKEFPNAQMSLGVVDLADLDSLKHFADSFSKEHSRLDLLVNNAGVMVPPLIRTKQGFELQFGTNHLGHFALTGRLLPLLEKAHGSRVVVVSSAGANFGHIILDDPQFSKKPYSKWEAYCQSKLANLMFALELARRLNAAHSTIKVTAAHPGGANTNLQRNTWFFRTFINPIAMSPTDGALPTLRAACDLEIENGTYWGPSKVFEMRGPAASAVIPTRAKDLSVSRKLWDLSERLTDVHFNFTEQKVVLSAH